MKIRKNLSTIKFVVLIILLASLIYFFRFSDYSKEVSINNIKSFIDSFGSLSFLAFVIFYAIGVALSIPGIIFTFIGGVLFGTLLGTILTTIGATIGAGLAFYVSRFLGRNFVESIIKGNIKKIDNYIHNKGFKGILFVRIVPLFPYVVVNFGAGLCNIKFKDYIIATFIGVIPGAFIYTYLFSTFGEKALSGDFSLRELLTLDFLLPISLLSILLLSPFIYKRFKKKKR